MRQKDVFGDLGEATPCKREGKLGSVPKTRQASLLSNYYYYYLKAELRNEMPATASDHFRAS